MPDILIIHLKRFHYVRETGYIEKLDELIKYPFNGLTLQKISELRKSESSGKVSNEIDSSVNDKLYDLYAVIDHLGTGTGGHYKAYVKLNQTTKN